MHRLVATVAIIFMLVSLAGCRSTTTTPQVATEQPSYEGLSPKERISAERWDAATVGIRFDSPSGLVAVQTLATGSPRQAATALGEADRLFGENRVMEALDQYVLAVRNDADLADGYVGIGRVARRKGKLDKSIAAFRTALDRRSDHRDALFGLATTLWNDAQQDEAIAQMTTLLLIDDEHARAHERLAVWSYYTGEHETAWEHLHRADALGQPVPEQLVGLLEEQMPDPGVQ